VKVLVIDTVAPEGIAFLVASTRRAQGDKRPERPGAVHRRKSQ
jgi:hypothetical protein